MSGNTSKQSCNHDDYVHGCLSLQKIYGFMFQYLSSTLDLLVEMSG